MILKERSPPQPTRRVLLKKALNKPSRQLRPRIKMRKDEGFSSSHLPDRKPQEPQEPPMFAESAIIPTVAFLSKLAETTWQADPFRARRFIEIN